MIVPFFTIDQDDEYVTVDLKISHLRFNASSLELAVTDNTMVFSLAPYFLRLRFPFPFEEDDDEKITAQYISQEDVLRLRLPKLNRGQFFPDLDFTAKLLARDGEAVAKEPALRAVDEELKVPRTESPNVPRPLIQELDMADKTRDVDLQHAESLNWEVEQQIPVDPVSIGVDSRFLYGFNDSHKSMLNITLSNGNDINELSDPDATDADDRIMERLIKENIKFDVDYYGSDYLLLKYGDTDDSKRIKDLLEWKFPLRKEFLKHAKAKQDGVKDVPETVPLEFTKDEQEKIQKLKVRQFLIDETRPLYQTIISILFAYCFDLRSGEGDTTVESGWNIGKLVPQIACLDSQLIPSNNSTETNLLKISVITSTRRALSYPLVRCWELVQKVWEDVYYVLRCGKRGVIKLLLAAREPFRFHDVYYVYNLIWFEELLGWCLGDDAFNEATLRDLAHSLRKETEGLTKSDITFEKCLDEETAEIEVVSLVDIEKWAEESYADGLGE
ncbi:unnamed protein product [Kuraishia capsulata CBS 1993]|uniref:CS domain-containing protein n=1 Tax=Kuraishia capsulata CBS 1993 TaxID=1382522 RepID=W6MIK4_9ASCO|nr:uncharacterized protein KUCA_T00001952001 [Kuraishia capsulata CBS 1993]CDK25981.1 unnamed protein product [Kuraishia capsulata CBS 1993]